VPEAHLRVGIRAPQGVGSYLDIDTDKESPMFARPSPTMATPAYRLKTSLGTMARGSLGDPVARWQRLDARRDGCVERTVVTSAATT
jgi:hypothetical protein